MAVYGDIQEVKFNQKTYYFIDLGKSLYETPSLRLWIHGDLVTNRIVRDYKDIAGRDRSIIKTPQNNLILIPDKGKFVFHVGRKPTDKYHKYKFDLVDAPVDIFLYDYYSTHTHVNGVSVFGLVVMDKPTLEITWNDGKKSKYELLKNYQHEVAI